MFFLIFPDTRRVVACRNRGRERGQCQGNSAYEVVYRLLGFPLLMLETSHDLSIPEFPRYQILRGMGM